MTAEFIAASGRLPARHRYRAAVRRFFREFRVPPRRTVLVVAVDDTAIRALNRELFRRDAVTDVISVTIDDTVDGQDIWGELYVSSQTARREARRRGLPWHDELLLYIVHGLLHLAGFDDDRADRRRRMWRRQREFLAACGCAPDPPGGRKGR